jgi:signal transduction histidine kinase
MSDLRPTAPSAITHGRVPLSVIAVILVSILLLMVNASLLIINTAETMESNAQYARSYEIKRALSGFQAVVTAAESGQRGYLLTGRSEYLEPFYLATRSWRTDIDRLRNLTANSAAHQNDIAELQILTASAISSLEQAIRRTAKAGPSGNADAAGTEQAKNSMDRVREMISRLEEEEDQRIEALRSEVLRDMWVTVGVAVFTTIVTVAVLLGLQKLLQRHTEARAKAELALREANLDLNLQVEQRTAELTELSQHLIRVSEEEKAKLARELHDTLGSNLTAINMDLNWLLRRLPEESRELRERLQRTLQMLSDTVELKHEVIEGLRPSHLDNLGLAFAMHSHCREFSRRTGIPCEVEVTEDFDDLDPGWSIAFYRIVQESLTNIAKHAQATEVRIQLQREAEGIRLRIADNGIGLAEGSSSKPKSHGLVGMRERMRQIGGQLTVARAPAGKGTLVEAFVPHRHELAGAVGEGLRAVG